ncbi:MAG: hypothetical protein LBJ61_12930 [Deltaproteobacteria bacterium]|jgi:hypothetical protein|nr:hypothetical protein [Deltaproteobacteria bacterium]
MDKRLEKTHQQNSDNAETNLLADPESVFDSEQNREAILQLKRIDGAIPGAMEALLSLALPAGSRRHQPKSYEIYSDIKRHIDAGMSIIGTARTLKIPYSTCHYYTKMTPAQVSELKKLSVNAKSKAKKA